VAYAVTRRVRAPSYKIVKEAVLTAFCSRAVKNELAGIIIVSITFDDDLRITREGGGVQKH
jgi:hypothetical protein